MKNTYIVKYKRGIAGRTMVSASDLDEAAREAVSHARFITGCIPVDHKAEDIIDSIEPAGDIPFGAFGHECRPTVQLGPGENFSPMTAKEAVANMQAPDFSEVAKQQTA